MHWRNNNHEHPLAKIWCYVAQRISVWKYCNRRNNLTTMKRRSPNRKESLAKGEKCGHKVWSLSQLELLTHCSWLIWLFSLKQLIAEPSLLHAVPTYADWLTVLNIFSPSLFLMESVYLVEEYLALQNIPAGFRAMGGVRHLWM